MKMVVFIFLLILAVQNLQANELVGVWSDIKDHSALEREPECWSDSAATNILYIKDDGVFGIISLRLCRSGLDILNLDSTIRLYPVHHNDDEFYLTVSTWELTEAKTLSLRVTSCYAERKCEEQDIQKSHYTFWGGGVKSQAYCVMPTDCVSNRLKKNEKAELHLIDSTLKLVGPVEIDFKRETHLWLYSIEYLEGITKLIRE